MSFKFESMLTILNKIDRGERVNVKSLMNDLEISERSVHRYLEQLQIAGFHILYDKSTESYRFQEGFQLKSVNLSVEENLAFALARKVLGNMGIGMEKELQKIEEKLNARKADIPNNIVLSAPSTAPNTVESLEAIHKAMTNYQRLEIVYSPIWSGETAKRKVDPYYIFYNDGFWYLRGHCHLSEGERTFGVDRIQSLKVLDKHFLPRKISPEEELSSAFGTWLDGEPTEVVLIFDIEAKARVLRKKWHKSQQVKELKDGRLEVRYNVKGYGGMKKWIYGWIPYVEVVRPLELREEMMKELKQSLTLLQKSKG